LPLIKTICKQCRERTGNWNFQDDRDWEYGVVFCSYAAQNNSVDLVYQNIDEPPPIGCEYRLEHVIHDNSH
jgi:hypothetical protein